MEQPLSVAAQRVLLNDFLQAANDGQVREVFEFYQTNLSRWISEEPMSAELLAELHRRRDAFLRGEMKASPLEEVKQRLAARQPRTK